MQLLGRAVSRTAELVLEEGPREPHGPGSLEIPEAELHRSRDASWTRGLDELRAVVTEVRTAFEANASYLLTLQLAVAQRQQEKQEHFNRLVALFGTAVLVPGLVAAVFGANVALPGRNTTRGLAVMLVLMLACGAGSWAALEIVSRHRETRPARSALAAAVVSAMAFVVAGLLMADVVRI